MSKVWSSLEARAAGRDLAKAVLAAGHRLVATARKPEDLHDLIAPLWRREKDEGGRLKVIVQAVLLGMLVVIAGTIPRNLLFAANLRYYASVPWAVPLTAVYLWFFWRYLNGGGPPESTAEERRASLRANRVSGRVWAWALLAGGLGIVALVLALRVANRLVVLPQQQLPGK
jgi:hypothetical protein